MKPQPLQTARLTSPVLLALILALGSNATSAQSTDSGQGGSHSRDSSAQTAGVLASSTPASSTTRNAGTNPNTLTTILLPVVGTVFLGSLDNQSTGHPIGLVIAYLTPANILLPGGQTLLTNVLDPAGAVVPFQAVDVFTGLFLIPIPNDPNLCGLAVSMQGVHVDPLFQANFLLSNALDLVLGV